MATATTHIVPISEFLLCTLLLGTVFEEGYIVYALRFNRWYVSLLDISFLFLSLVLWKIFFDRNNKIQYFYFVGFMLLSGWAWHVICAPDIFSWNFTFLLLNIGQLVYIVYQMRPVRFDPELEEVYHTLFYPFKVSRPMYIR